MSENIGDEGQSADNSGLIREFFDHYDKILFILIPVIGYATLYRFQAAYIDFYKVPTQYIGFSLSAIVIASSLVIPVVILLVAPILIVGYLWRGFCLWTVSKFELLFEERPRVTHFLNKLGQPFCWSSTILLMLGLLMLSTHAYGYAYASIRSEYSVAETSPEMVVVYATAEHAVLSKFDRNSQTIYSEYTILMTEDFDGIKFHPEKLGRMEVKPLPRPGNTGPTLSPNAAVTVTPP